MEYVTKITIDLNQYRKNVLVLKKYMEPCKLCVVVKADAYGHGIDRIVPVAVEAGADYLGVTENWEVKAIQEKGIKLPIIRLRPALREEIEEVLDVGVEEIVGSYEGAKTISKLGEKLGKLIPVHIKVDTGIGRMGFSVQGQTDEIKKIIHLPGVKVVGLMTHFPSADEEDIKITEKQEEKFRKVYEEFLELLPKDILIHSANSAVTLRYPKYHNSLARVGIASYGLKPSKYVNLPPEIKLVLSWKTVVVQIREVPKGATIGYGMTYTCEKDTKVVTLPVGYANGYLRKLSNNAEVLIQGKRCPIIGRVSMNMITVDVTNLDRVKIGDEVVLCGKQGGEEIIMDELAEKAETINYEMACLIGNSNYRTYTV